MGTGRDRSSGGGRISPSTLPGGRQATGPAERQKLPGCSRPMLRCPGDAPWGVCSPPLQTPNPKQSLRGGDGPSGLSRALSNAGGQLRASGQALVGIPRAEPVFRSRLLLSQGNGTLQKCLHSPVLGIQQTHRGREVRAWVCCNINALSVPVLRSPGPVPL